MICVAIKDNFASWRKIARKLLLAKIPPNEILWTNETQNGLFETDFDKNLNDKIIKVSPEFLEIAETASCFDDFEKWSVLYSLLFRLVYENRNLLFIESDEDVRRVLLMEKAVLRDIHKFHAFVRFRRVEIEEKEVFVAWHEPHHWTVERAAPFFVRRFGAMIFSILTPKGCAHWDLENLTFSEAVSEDSAPEYDETEDFWLTYYKSIFNPFRLKVKAMKKEFPVRHWRTLPEAVLIPELIRQAKES